jgi:hypothetical protein
MSRKSKGIQVDNLDGMVVLQCPSGHTVATVRKSLGRYHMTAGDFQGVNPLDHPLAVTCRSCVAAGRRLDLRGSWVKVLALLDEVEADTTRHAATYMLGV